MVSPQAQDFRIYLQNELVRRCKANARYSLRAFSRYLNVEPSYLSKILSGKRAVTLATLKRFSERLNLSPEQILSFQNGIRGKYSSSLEGGADLPFKALDLDYFQLISDWYHYAILELATIDEFHLDPKAISKALGVSLAEAQAAMERLKRTGLLTEEKDSQKIENHTTLNSNFTAVAFRHLQKQILEKAVQAMEEIPLERRDQTSMTMAIDPALLPEAKRMITDFRRKLCSYLQSKSRKEVYHLSISLYPVTHLNLDTESKSPKGKRYEN